MILLIIEKREALQTYQQTLPVGSGDFGDGNTSTQQNPTHTYNPVGNYTATLTVNGQADCQAEYDVDVAVGIRENATGQTIRLIPNPASDDVTVKFGEDLNENTQLEIYAADGRIVKSITLNQGMNQVQFSIANLENALYSELARAPPEAA